jgi:Na+-exporting ATPase
MAEKNPDLSDHHQFSGAQDQEKDKSFNRANTTDTRATAVSQALPFAPHNTASSKVLEALSSDADHGLSEEDARKRLELYGPNRLKPPKRPSVMKIIVRQVGNAMTLVLSESGVGSPLGCSVAGPLPRAGVGPPCRDVLLDWMLKPVSVAAMAVSFGTMDWISGGVIAALVILNVAVGSYTEWQAEKASGSSPPCRCRDA